MKKNNLIFFNKMLAVIIVCLQIQFVQAQKVVPYQDDYFVINHFKFSEGAEMDSLRIHYYYVGTPHVNKQGNIDNAVLIMHGTGGSGESFLTANYAGQLFKEGQLLDAAKYFIILPDAIGHGKSSKPSDGMKMKFPAYTYDDMVDANYLLFTQKLHVQHARMVMGTSMGGMQTWVWGYRYPEFMDALMPLASLPIEIAGRNRIIRKMMINSIKEDPKWNQGNYTEQPQLGLKGALNLLMMMSSVPLQYQKDAPTRETAELFLDKWMANAQKGRDANDMIYQFDASRKYNPAPHLEKIKAPLLAINSADDQVNPPELNVMDSSIKKLAKGKFILLPISSETRGHGTHSLPKVWGSYLQSFLKETEKIER